MVDANDNTSPKPSQHFVDGISKDEVVFISQPKGFYSACWGGLMSTRAMYLGAQGVVVDGNVRDLNEHREMNFPVSISLPITLWETFADIYGAEIGLCKGNFSIGI